MTNEPVVVDTSYWIEYFNRPGAVEAQIREDRAALNDHDGSIGDAHTALPAKPPGLWVVELILPPSEGLYAARNAFTADVSLAPPP